MALVTGYASKLFRNTGTYGSPTWAEITDVKDLTYTMEDTMHDATTRAHSGYKGYIQTLRNIEITWGMNYDTSDTQYVALRTAFLARTAVEFLVLDGANTSPSQGIRATCQIFSFPISQPLDGNLVTDIKAAPYAGAANPPAWYSAV